MSKWHALSVQAWRGLAPSALLSAALVLAACGGGGGVSSTTDVTSTACSVPAQKDWLRDYMAEWYFWYLQSPSPDPASFASVDNYFGALLFAGDTTFPRDRYSGSSTTAAFNQFFEEGKTLGYGAFVAGLEVAGRPDLPLYVRYVEASSDAALRGVQRGDEILSANGRSTADILRASDFSAFTPSQPGDTLALRLRSAAGGAPSERSVTLTASNYPLAPVSGANVVTLANGKTMGYLFVKDMVSQTAPGLAAAFGQFRGAGVSELVLDLRYNGGGFVSVAGNLASYIAGSVGEGRIFTSLVFNDKRGASNNSQVAFSSPGPALNLRRVFVLMGSRTCSASELVVNGLRGVGIDVVTVGATSCGKPVGFLPQAHCGTTFSVVNFESVNALGQGRYFNGITAQCAALDNPIQALGSQADNLMVAARAVAVGGTCVAGSAAAVPTERRTLSARLRSTTSELDPGERQGMVGR